MAYFSLLLLSTKIFLYTDNTAVLISTNNDDNNSLWCTNICIVGNPAKSTYFAFDSTLNIVINNHVLSNTLFVKFLSILFDNKLSWKYQVSHVTAMCSQRLGLFKWVLFYFPNNVTALYYNAFVTSICSYCLLHCLNNARSS